MSHSGGPQINVTPLIDVLLVLLVIFLVIIPVMVKTETVAMPPNEGDPLSPPIVVKLHADATATIDEGAPLMATDLMPRLRPRVKEGATVFVDFEDGVPWGDVVRNGRRRARARRQPREHRGRRAHPRVIRSARRVRRCAAGSR